MRRDDVICLHEALLRDLPVATHETSDVSLLVALFEGPALEVLRQVTDIGLEGFGLFGPVDEYEATPGACPELGQVIIVALDMREVPSAGKRPQASVEIPGPAVEGTPQHVAAPRGVLQRSTSVQTGIGERANLPIFPANDQGLQTSDFVHRMITRLGDLFGSGLRPSWSASPQSCCWDC